MTATRRSARFLRTALAAGAATGLVLLSGCSSSSDDSDSGGSGADSAAARDVAGEVPQAEPAPAEDAGGGSAETVADTTNPGVEAQQVISTGNVQLRSDDVGQAMFDIRKVVDLHQGTVSEDNTETDEDGGALRSRMVLRIPTADFDEAMTELEKVATLVSSQRESADVTTQVLDPDVDVEHLGGDVGALSLGGDQRPDPLELGHRVVEVGGRDAQHHPRAERPTVVVGLGVVLRDRAVMPVHDLADVEDRLPDVLRAELDGPG